MIYLIIKYLWNQMVFLPDRTWARKIVNNYLIVIQTKFHLVNNFKEIALWYELFFSDFYHLISYYKFIFFSYIIPYDKFILISYLISYDKFILFSYSIYYKFVTGNKC